MNINFPTVGFILFSMMAASAGHADEVKFDARSLWQRATTSNIRLAGDNSALELDHGELFEDDGPAAGYSYKSNEEKLSATTWAKKEFHLPGASAARATLLIAPGGVPRAIINDQPRSLPAPTKVGQYWQAYELPPDWLRAGKNEIILHGSGKLWIARADEFVQGSLTRGKHPNRSAKSIDAGKTWDDERLGPDGEADGEYYMRLFLHRYRPRGVVTLPILDAGNLSGPLVAAPVLSVGPIRIVANAENGSASGLKLRVRSGSTYSPDPKHWSDWHDLNARGGVLDAPAGRFVQIMVELATSDPLRTPRLKQIIIESKPTRPADWTQKVRVLDISNAEIVRTSIPFAYEPLDHPRLKVLRKTYRLDEVVAGARVEFELILRLAAWTSRQWAKGHLREAYPPWDALEILKLHSDGTPIGGFCQQYNLVFLQACESFGLVGRAVSLGPGPYASRIRSGHEVVEIWSNTHRKWVYVDGQMAWYFVDPKSEVPLSLLELRERQLAVLRGKAADPIKLMQIAPVEPRWQGLESFPPFVELRLIPRSNFLQEKAPLPLNQGMRGWFWTGHYAWTDEDAPAALLYGNRVRHRRNWEWSLNQTHFVLEATDKPGELRVHLDTETPGFAGYLVNLNGRAIQSNSSEFRATLQKGRNRMEVRSSNLAGREGTASWVSLDYE